MLYHCGHAATLCRRMCRTGCSARPAEESELARYRFSHNRLGFDHDNFFLLLGARRNSGEQANEDNSFDALRHLSLLVLFRAWPRRVTRHCPSYEVRALANRVQTLTHRIREEYALQPSQANCGQSASTPPHSAAIEPTCAEGSPVTWDPSLDFARYITWVPRPLP